MFLFGGEIGWMKNFREKIGIKTFLTVLGWVGSKENKLWGPCIFFLGPPKSSLQNGEKTEGKKRKEKGGTEHEHFCLLNSLIFSLQFSFHFGENFLVGLERKYMDPIIYFLCSPSNQAQSKKFSFPFSL